MAKSLNPVGLTLKEYSMKTKVKKFDLIESSDRKGVSALRMNSLMFYFEQVKKTDKFLEPKNLAECVIREGNRPNSFFIRNDGKKVVKSDSF